MVSIYDKNFRAFPLTGEKIEVLQCKKMKFRNAGYADIRKQLEQVKRNSITQFFVELFTQCIF
jgi:hypothetical protein